jgi:GGDEF domain-containing protein
MDLPSERSLTAKMRQLGHSQKGVAPAAVIVLELDLFAEQARFLGEDAALSLERSLAKLFTQHVPPSAGLLGHVGPGQFAIVLLQTTSDAARKYAHNACQAIGKSLTRPATLSAGVAILEPDDQDLTGLFRRAHQALRLAQDNGRNCVVVEGDFQQEVTQWRECVARGNPFASNLGKDVMTPCTLWLAPDDTVQKAVAALQRTRLPLLPVMDDQSHLTGIVLAEQCKSLKRTQPQATIRSIMSTDFLQMEVDVEYESVMRHFLKNQKTPIFFVQEQIPQGFVTFSSFVAMVAKLNSNSFSVAPAPTGAQYLLVPDHHHTDNSPVAAS